MSEDQIIIRGAREHNLAGVDLDLPRNALIVFTGVSGSGKSSLAFDTLFAEGQRLYLESLSTYARQFLQQLPRPRVDRLDGLAPGIAINQAQRGHNPRSTVATVTEIYDYLRVLYAAIGHAHCPDCHVEIGAQTREAIIERIAILPDERTTFILAPLIHARQGEFKDLLEDMRRRGYLRTRIDGELYDTDNPPSLDRRRRHNLEIVMDRLAPGLRSSPDYRQRIAEAVDAALELSEGDVMIARENEQDLLLSTRFACPSCDRSFSEPTHASFSFNSPQGMCPECQGLGVSRVMDPVLLVEFPEKSLLDGAVPLLPSLNNDYRRHWYDGVASHYEFDLNTPWDNLTAQQREVLLYGSGNVAIDYYYIHRTGWDWRHSEPFGGIIADLMYRMNRLKAKSLLAKYEATLRTGRCPACKGLRLKPESLAVTIGELNLSQLCMKTVEQSAEFFNTLALTPAETTIAGEALAEVSDRLSFLDHVGLHYLTLDRSAPTLSGGESQRIRLASQVGSGLVDCLYVLDEPSIGLHHRDQGRLLDTLLHLRDLDNTIIVVEHDEQTMLTADYIVDFGPGAGEKGGRVVAAGTPKQVQNNRLSLTGQYLTGKRHIPVPETRRAANGLHLTIRGARHNNLQNIDVQFPLGLLICVTGVSGSGKSSLVNDILWATLAKELNRAETEPGACDAVEGLEHLKKAIVIDQDPIGRTPRSNPATYTKVFDIIRDLFANLPESQVRGYKPGRFSFNVAEGRCETCEGHGAVRLESDFLADMWVTCEDCGGQRFDRETLTITFKGHTIADVLEMEVTEALEVFNNIPRIRHILQTLADVGLGYIKLGQPATTVSGGEAQRIKLAKELARPGGQECIYLLDEPTTGLHFEDVRRLLEVLQRLVDTGSTVIVVEHHPNIIAASDWLIDLGPEGGAGGGEVVVVGTPEQVAQCQASHTGAMLREMSEAGSVTAAPHHHTRRTRRTRTESITVHGANEHNLKNIDVKIPRRKFTVMTGVSGSGKTSLALDTVYAEGQRRYVESLSSYARQFVNQMSRPKVDRVTGLSPGIAIEQRNSIRTPRSTVGTETQIYDYLRVLYARLATPHCPDCGEPLGIRTIDDTVDEIITSLTDRVSLILAPFTPEGNQEWVEIFSRLERDGWRRFRIDGELFTLPLEAPIDRRRRHAVELVVDRLNPDDTHRSRVAEAVEKAFAVSGGEVIAVEMEPAPGTVAIELRLSRDFGCTQCGTSFAELNPRSFSFNHPDGWCDTCYGIGTQRGLDPEVMVPDPRLSLRQGAISVWPALNEGVLLTQTLEALAEFGGFTLDQPFETLTPEQMRLVYEGTAKEIPVTPTLRVRYTGLSTGIEEASNLSYHFRRQYARALGDLPCPACRGGRLKPLAAAAKFRGLTLVELCEFPLDWVEQGLSKIVLTEDEQARTGEVLDEISQRLTFLVKVGLDYLNLHRPAPTLSGGEAQRVKLAAQLGARLTGVMYVLDEPTVGIHPRDNDRMLAALETLRDLGNTVIVVEHDPQTIARADHIIDFGPGAGPNGGTVVAEGSPARLAKAKHSLTGQLLAKTLGVPVPTNRRELPESPNWLRIEGARHHNLKNIDVEIPLGVFTCVTGPSGSGKSSLITEILHPELSYRLHGKNLQPGHHRSIRGYESLKQVITIDQSPIGNSPRSNPVTYIGVFDAIRELFALLPESKVRGFTPRRFSFNARGGRCEACEGMGFRFVEMHFLPDVWVECEVCNGQRYNPETLAVKYRGKNIAQVLETSVDEASELFKDLPRICRMLQVLADVGLGYLPLGQSAPTLSGGEAQRMKIARELVHPAQGQALYMLDEPTTGLHIADIQKLLMVLNRLVDAGNSVLVIEHNFDVVKTADWLIDLGPEGGEAGGYLVAAGRPEEVADKEIGPTAPYLQEMLQNSAHEQRPVYLPKQMRKRQISEITQAADVKPPWELDGEGWHTRERVNENGENPAWRDEALIAFVELYRKLPDAPEPVWHHRNDVFFPLPDGKQEFLSARTSGKWYLQLSFRLPKGHVNEDHLSEQLALPSWEEIPGQTHLARQHRVACYTAASKHDRVMIFTFVPEDVQTSGFKSFLQAAWQAGRDAFGKPKAKKKKTATSASKGGKK